MKSKLSAFLLWKAMQKNKMSKNRKKVSIFALFFA